MKIKCFRFPCEVFAKNKIAYSIQVFFRKMEKYLMLGQGTKGVDKKFYYNQQNKEYVNRKLRERGNIDPVQLFQQKNTDLDKAQKNPKALMAGPMGFEPMTFSLEG